MGLRPLWTTMSSYSSWGQRGQAKGLRQLPPCPLPKFPHPPWEPGAASKPELPAPKSKSQLLVLSPPLPRSPVFSRPCGLSSPSATTGRSPPLPHFLLPLPKFLNPCQSATTPAHSHVSLTGLSKEAPSPLAEVVPHCCQCSNHCCPRSPSHSLRSPALAPRKKSPAAILCCLCLPTTTTEVLSLSPLEFCLCHCLHFSPAGA